MKFSVIIPVYNVEDYIYECVNSVLEQEYGDYEIILVDDGSTDSSPEICDSMAQQHACIKVIHKQNGGLSDARNTGIEKSTGEYLLFLDGDDFYSEKGFLKKACEFAEKYNRPEILNYTWREYYTKDGTYADKNALYDEQLNSRFSDNDELIRYLINNDMLSPSVCDKIIRRDFITNNGLFFKKCLLSEDIEWYMRAAACDFRQVFMGIAPYVYRKQRDGSITSTIRGKNINDLLDTIENYYGLYLKENTERSKLLINYLAYQYSIVCGLLVRVTDKNEKRDIYRRLYKNREILSYRLSNKVKKVYFIYKFFGLRITVPILNLYIKYRGKK